MALFPDAAGSLHISNQKKKGMEAEQTTPFEKGFLRHRWLENEINGFGKGKVMGKNVIFQKSPLHFCCFFLCQPALCFFQRGVNLRLASSFGEAHREAIPFLKWN